VALDLQMPYMGGFEVCALLRGMFGRTKPRILALTAFASKANVGKAIAAGADACIAKGTSVEVLLRELRISAVLS
jgi:CheY-like chemotaxis protein